MDFALDAEQELVRATAREFCDRELVPHSRDWDEAEELPRELVGSLAEAGFLAASIPEEHGGGGLDTISYTLLCEELGRADSSVRGIVSVAPSACRGLRAARRSAATRSPNPAAAPTRRRSRLAPSATAPVGC